MYYRILAYVDSVDDSSYPRNEKQADGSMKEVLFEQYTYVLRVPGQKDYARVTLAADKGPTKDKRDAWEDVETLVSVEADRLTTVVGMNDGKPWAFTSFNGTAIQEASQDEQKALKAKRRVIKADLKAKRDAAHQAKLASKKQAA